MKTGHTSADIDTYVAGFPEPVQVLLRKMRDTIRKAAPGAVEKISYQIPTFALHGNLVHFAAFKNHIGFYPGASGIKAFQQELSAYVFAKGSVQFPLDKPLPVGLISKIVKFRVQENMDKAVRKGKQRSG